MIVYKLQMYEKPKQMYITNICIRLSIIDKYQHLRHQARYRRFLMKSTVRIVNIVIGEFIWV